MITKATIKIWSGKELKDVPLYDSALPRPFESVREVRVYWVNPDNILAYDRAGRSIGQVLAPSLREIENHPAAFSRGSGLLDEEAGIQYDRILINVATVRIRFGREEARECGS